MKSNTAMKSSMRDAKVGTNLTPNKKIRFRGETSRVEELLENTKKVELAGENPTSSQKDAPVEDSGSFLDFFKVEMTRSYQLEHDEERYVVRRAKVCAFLRVSLELERFIIYGVIQCIDSFLYVLTFLPIRCVTALWHFVTRLLARLLRLRCPSQRLLQPAEMCDLLKASLWACATLMLLFIDTNMLYHIIKSQSTIRLYILFNIMEVGDRLLSAFGTDIMDSMLWSSTTPRRPEDYRFGYIVIAIVAFIYMAMHTVLIMFQAIALNVATNAHNRSLLTIMVSNNFVELKGAVFKKFDKNNLFQLTCSDVRERFHLFSLLLIVILQTMKQCTWLTDDNADDQDMAFHLLKAFFIVLFVECLIDYFKHAFITRFNDLPADVYKEYKASLAYDLSQTRQKHAFSDHSDLVARRMGFIPFPLAANLIKAIYTSVPFHNVAAWLLLGLAFCLALLVRLAVVIFSLGKACEIMKTHQAERSSPTTTASSCAAAGTAVVSEVPASVVSNETKAAGSQNASRCHVVSAADVTENWDTSCFELHSTSASTPNRTRYATEPPPAAMELGATAIFANSEVDLQDVCLNDKVIDASNGQSIYQDEELARSEPRLQSPKSETKATTAIRRTHKRSESEPGMIVNGTVEPSETLA